MSIREVDYRDGTKIRLRGNHYEGKLGVGINGFAFEKAVGQEEVIDLTSAQCSNLDLRYGNIYNVDLTSNITIRLSNGVPGTYIFIFKQDATGGRTISFSGNFYYLVSAGAPDFSTDSGGAINIVTLLYDGRNFYVNYLQNFTT